MIGIEDSPSTYLYDDYYKILPSINEWVWINQRQEVKKLMITLSTAATLMMSGCQKRILNCQKIIIRLVRLMIPYGRQEITEEDIKAVVVLNSDFLTQGPKVQNLKN